MALKKFGLALGSVAILAGCAGSQPAHLASFASTNSKTNSQIGTKIIIVELLDQRPKNAVLTDFSGRPFSGELFSEWVKSSLSKRGFTLALGKGGVSTIDEASSCNIKLSVRQAEVDIHETSKRAAFVFEVEDVVRAGASQIVRGQASSINWASGDSEANGVLSKAFDKALVKTAQFCAR